MPRSAWERSAGTARVSTQHTAKIEESRSSGGI
jgi:hypothetical protein